MIVNKIIKATEPVNIGITGATLLSVEEAEALQDPLRGYPAHLREYNNVWWLRSPGFYPDEAAYVSRCGEVKDNGDDVSSGKGVRPALIISNLESSNLQIGDIFEFGGKEFKIISGNIAFCVDDIGQSCFRSDYEADDANDYEKSDVKKFLDGWFEKATEEAGNV